MKTIQLTLCLLLVLFIISCQQEPQKVQQDSEIPLQTIIADTIRYNVLIKNPDPIDTWTEEGLSKLKKNHLIDILFDAVYDGKMSAYSFFTDEQLSINDIKDLEELEEFDREKIARVQFEELWLLDEESLTMTKKVYSIMIAYELQNDDGEIRGYKPAFKVYFNN